MENEESNKIIQRDSFKLTKNTKGYNYEFKLIKTDLETVEAFQNRINEFNIWALNNYGVSNEI